jgi:ribulose-bisphosphate carboxylase large chain
MGKKTVSEEKPVEAALYRHKKVCRWTGVKVDRYKKADGGWLSITRQALVGKQEPGAKFHLRYFEVDPGGFSSLERHRHEHLVICARGRGRIRIGDKTRSFKQMDVAYIGPNTVHQLQNPYNEPFGFFCVVSAKRDRPKPVPDINRKGKH